MEALSTPCSEATTTTTINGSVPSIHDSLPSYHELSSSTQHQQTTPSYHELSSSTQHQQTTGPGDTSHCDRCNKNFIDKESLAIHLRYHHGDLLNMWMNPIESREDLSQSQSEIPTAETPLGEFRDITLSDMTEDERNALSAVTDTAGLDLPLDSNGFDTNMNDSIADGDHLKMLTGDSFQTQHQQDQQQEMQSLEQKYMIPNPSPSLQFNNYPSPMMPSPQGNIVPTGPSSTHSNTSGTYHPNSSQYYPEFTQLQTVSSMPQQSPGLHHNSLPHYSQSHYSGNPHHGGGGEASGIGFGDHYGAHSMGRYHPYGRSPSASPSVVKEEPKPATSESQEILDLDTHRFLGANAGAVDNQTTDRNLQLGYRPSMPHSTYPRNTTSFVSPREPGTIISSSMFGGGTVHSQRSPPMSEMGGAPYGYMPQASLPSYHQQSYPAAPSVPSASPASSPSSQPGPQTASDLPPSPSEFPTNVKRPKNFRCEICLKWFTSQGHLKRHYNTNIHRNMVKQKESKEAELAKTNSLQSSPQIPTTSTTTTTQSSQVTATTGINHYQPSPAEEQSVVSPPLRSGNDYEQNSLSGGSSSLLGLEPEERKAQVGESSPFPVQNNNISSQPARPTPVPASSMFSSVASFQPGYSQPNYSQINTVQPQYASTPLYAADSSSIPPTSSSSTTYYGHFSTNPSPYEQASLSNNSSAVQPVFQAGSTPMIGGGFLHHNNSISPNTLSSTSNSLPGSSHSQSISPKLISPQLPSGDYQSPEVHSTNECSSTIKSEYGDSRGSIDQYSSMLNRPDSFSAYSCDLGQNANALPVVDGMQSNSEGRDSNKVPSTRYTAGSPEGIISSSSPDATKASETTVRSPSAGSPDSFITSGSGASPEPDKNDGKFYCSHCGMSFAKKCYLTQHFEKHLIGDENYKCDKCGKKYNDKKIFEVHVSKHEGDKPYKCEYDSCIKQFNHKTDLRRHMCLHTGEKPFKCDQCTKGFIRKDHMMKHMQTHKKKQATAATAPNPRLQNTTLPDQVPSMPFQYPMLPTPYGSGMISVMPPRPTQFPPLTDFPGHHNSYQHLMHQPDIKQESGLPQHHLHHHHHEVAPFVRVDY